MNVKPKQIAFFFSAGIGNSITLIPLIKALQSQNQNIEITGFFDSPFSVEELFWDQSIIQHKVILTNTLQYFRCINKWKYFDEIYLDFFSVSRKNLFFSSCIAKKVFAHKKRIGWKPFFLNNIFFKEIETGKHVIDINMNLLNTELLYYKVDYFLTNPPPFHSFTTSSKYIAIQVGSGNNLTPYKTWPINHWVELIQRIQLSWPLLNIVLLGDKNEIDLAKKVTQNVENIHSYIGKTSIQEASYILKNAQFFLGHDSGLMHIAAAFNVNTITIWGGSDYTLFGYQFFDEKKHIIISSSPNCWPCNSWVKPNQTRVSNPLFCPDFKCIQKISVESVFEIFQKRFSANTL